MPVTFDVVLTRGERGLGLDLDKENIIARVVAGSPAQQQGDLRVGDRVVAVEGTAISGKTHAAEVMNFSADTYTFTICRRPQSQDELQAITAGVVCSRSCPSVLSRWYSA